MQNNNQVQLALPKGRMLNGVQQLLSDSGCPVTTSDRDYRAQIALEGFSTKLLKPQSIVEMLGADRRDLGFAGADWVAELGADLVPLLDTELNPVRVIAAAPESFLEDGQLPKKPMVVASEYAQLTQRWMASRSIEGRFLRSWGATEVLPPEDADCIVDNTATGATLRANRLIIVDELMRSSTMLYASKAAMECPSKRERIESLVVVLQAVLDARRRVMLEFNLDVEKMSAVLAMVPSMREPTLSPLRGEQGVAVRAAVPKTALAQLIPTLKKQGATDIVVSRIDQIVA